MKLLNTQSELRKTRFDINNGLNSRIEIAQNEQDLILTLYFEGTYRTHTIEEVENPIRLALHITGEPVEHSHAGQTDPPGSTQPVMTDNKPVIRRVGVSRNLPSRAEKPVTRKSAEIDDATLRKIFPDDAELYLDLYEVPIHQVLRFFSRRSERK